MKKQKLINYKKLKDEELMILTSNDDIEAFNEIVKRYKNKLANFVFRYINDREEIEDIVQETFIRLYKSRKRYYVGASFSTFLYTIALNYLRTLLKKQSRWKFISLSKIKDDGEEYIKEFLFSHNDLEEKISGTFTKDAVLKALESVNETFKQALILRDIEGLTYEEISEILNIPKGTVKSRINRGRLQLRKKLKLMEKQLKEMENNL